MEERYLWKVAFKLKYYILPDTVYELHVSTEYKNQKLAQATTLELIKKIYSHQFKFDGFVRIEYVGKTYNLKAASQTKAK